jgi:hypothetical protein
MLRRTAFRQIRPAMPPKLRDREPAEPSTIRPLVSGTYGGGVGVAVPKGEKAKPGKRKPTVAEQAWMEAIVAYGCIACRSDGLAPRPTAVHHIVRGGQRMGHLFTLPLCDPGHHQGGQPLGLISRHPWKARFEAQYGTEMELLERLRAELKETA